MSSPESSGVIGVGLDLVSIRRFRRALERWGERLTSRVFTPAEIAYCSGRRHPEMHLAARFAAKEALLKTLGTGVSQGLALRQVEVVRGAGGRPEIALHGKAHVISSAKGFIAFHLSMSHTEDHAAACVVGVGPIHGD